MQTPIYNLDGIVLYHGDCRVILPQIMDKIDLCFTDPPYGVNYDGGSTVREKIEGDDSAKLYSEALPMIKAMMKPDAALYLFYADGDAAVTAAVTAAGFEVRNTIIWNKNMAQFGAFSANYKQKHEPFLYCYIKGKSPRWFGPTNETTVWDCARSSSNVFHPTQKPCSLAMRAMTNSSEPGDLVLDPFAGGGSTLVAAKMLRRRAIGIELRLDYCNTIISRLSQETLPFISAPHEKAQQEAFQL